MWTKKTLRFFFIITKYYLYYLKNSINTLMKNENLYNQRHKYGFLEVTQEALLCLK